MIQILIQEVVLVVQFPDHHHKGLYHRERHAVKLPLMVQKEQQRVIAC